MKRPMARYWWLLGPGDDFEQVRLSGKTTDVYLRLHFGIVHDGWEGHVSRAFSCSSGWMITILNLSHTGFQVVQCQIADLIFQTIKIHTEISDRGGWEMKTSREW